MSHDLVLYVVIKILDNPGFLNKQFCQIRQMWQTNPEYTNWEAIKQHSDSRAGYF